MMHGEQMMKGVKLVFKLIHKDLARIDIVTSLPQN